MLWQKAWFDTRWRFLIGLALLLAAACGTLFSYDALRNLLPTIGAANVPDSPLTEAIEEAVRIQRNFRGFVWYQWFRGNLQSLAILFAALLGTGSPLTGRSVLFTLALPVSRGDWLRSRAALGLAELAVLILVPSVVIALGAPLVRESYGIGDALVHSTCAFVVSTVFFSLAVLLSTFFNDTWRPLLLTCGAALVVGLSEYAFPNGGLLAVMSGRRYFETGSLPWLGLLVSVALCAGLLQGARTRLASRDF
jgi:hypothetical protein